MFMIINAVKKQGKKYTKKLLTHLPQRPKKAQVIEMDGTAAGAVVKYMVKNGEWAAQKAAENEETFVRRDGLAAVWDGVIEHSFVAKSRSMDAFYTECLQSGVYTEKNMLVIVNPYLLSPLTAMAFFQTSEEYSICAEVKGDLGGDKVGSTDVSGRTELSTRHRVPIVGLYADTKNSVCLQFFDKKGKLCRIVMLEVHTEPLPQGIQNMVTVTKNTKPSAFGLTFVYGGDTRYPYAFDRKGTLRFYIKRQPKPYGLHFLSNGHFLFAEKDILMPSFSNPHSSQALEMDILGRVHRLFNIENGLHHDASEMAPGGNILAAGSTLEHSNEDMIIELDRETGKIVKQVKLTEIFDKTYQDGIDWVHLNTVSYDQKTNSVLICCRNLHTVAKIDWGTGKLVWMLCNPRFWKNTSMEGMLLKPVGKNLKKEGWFYQAHAAYFLEDDLDENPDIRHMIIYDNHWHKRRSVKFFDGDSNSFVRIYEINEKEHTVSLYKSFPCEKSKIRSNGILCREQNRVFAMSGFLEPLIDNCAGMINEYDFQSGELINQCLTRSSYYRAYELPLNFEDLARPMGNDRYLLGSLRKPYRTEQPNVLEALPIPERQNQKSGELYYKGTKAERKRKYQEVIEQMGEAFFDTEQDLANIKFSITENVMYMHAVDHLVQKVYFVGEKNTYVQDYSDTEQTNMELFGRMYYAVAIPLGELLEGSYHIYAECNGTLYDTGKNVAMR